VLSRRATAVVVAAITLLFLLPFFGAGPAVILQWALIFACALAFVLLFTELTMRSQLARLEVERLAGELGEANQRLREYAAQAEELARTRERNRLAREIHDSLGHYLTVVNVQLEAARALLESRGWQKTAPELNTALEKAQALTRDGLADVRRSVAALRSNPIGDKPLLDAVNALAEELREAGLVTTLEFEGDASRLTPQVETALYRTVQEALTNIRKHARASQVNIQLVVGARTVTVEVRDNGVGLAEETAEENKFGLLGLRERAELLHGVFEVGAAPEGGVRLALELPLEAEAPKPPPAVPLL
jgi:signal transduction histidine kinase